MERSGPAKAHHREVARIIALLDRDHAERAEHVFVDDVDDAACRRHQVNAKRISDGLHGRLGALAIKLERAAEQIFRQIAEHDIGIRYSRGDAAFPVSNRTRNGAR